MSDTLICGVSYEDFVIRTVSGDGPYPDIVIAGGRLRGTMYGVFTFLDKLGFRWYTNRKTWLPKDTRLPVPYFDEKITDAKLTELLRYIGLADEVS